jgi:predicted lipase
MKLPSVDTYLAIARDARLSYTEIKKKYPGAIWIESEKTDTQGFCFKTDYFKNRLIFSFRGSQQLQDWFNDFNAFHLVYPYGNEDSKIKVHKGFITCYQSVREQIHYIINKEIANNGVDTIGTDGHSLGGALSVLAAVDIQYNFEKYLLENNKMNVYPVYGYASGNPKVGNKAFTDSFNKRIKFFIRTHHLRDWVPECPPTNFGKLLHGGYHHCGISNPIGKKCLFDGLRFWINYNRNPSKLLENITNHSIELYLRCC